MSSAPGQESVEDLASEGESVELEFIPLAKKRKGIVLSPGLACFAGLDP